MIGVAQDDLGLHLFAQFAEMYSFHATAGAYGHEDGRAYLSVVCSNQTSSCIAVWVGMLQFESHEAPPSAPEGAVSSVMVKSVGFFTSSFVNAKSQTS